MSSGLTTDFMHKGVKYLLYPLRYTVGLPTNYFTHVLNLAIHYIHALGTSCMHQPNCAQCTGINLTYAHINSMPILVILECIVSFRFKVDISYNTHNNLFMNLRIGVFNTTLARMFIAYVFLFEKIM